MHRFGSVHLFIMFHSLIIHRLVHN
jgi:hypothetical protein